MDTASGETFEHLHDEGASEGEAPDFDGFVAEYLDSIASGERRIDPELGVVFADTGPPRQLQSLPPSARASSRVTLVAVFAILVLAALLFALQQGG